MTAAAATLSAAYPLGSRVNERGHLEIGGCDAVELAARFGTPAYVVAEDDLRHRGRTFVESLRARHPDSEVVFASKAFPCTAVYRVLAEEGLGCDVASGGELHLALRGGFDAARLYFHGNAKSEREIAEALDAGVGHIVLDGWADLERVERIAAERGAGQAVLLRVTPDVAGETHEKISTGQADSKFGFGLGEARVAIERLGDSPSLRLRGLHFHIGSQLHSLAPFREAVAAIAPLGDFPVYSLGGGLAATYTAEDAPAPPIEDYVEAKVTAVHEILGPGKRIVIEPGRALVANSGVTLYRIENVKRNVSTWVAVDGGMSDNLRPMLYGAIYEARIADRAGAVGGEQCTLTGKHCESGDVIVRRALLHEPRAGDVVVTPATGAYGHALANNYNGVPRPPVVFCKDGEARVVVRRETYDDLTARDLA
jgi:diaminopimelate decarboxylase